MSRFCRICSILFTLFVAIGSQQRRSSMVCLNGVERSGKCECNDGYFGKNCERSPHCQGFKQHSNGSCIACQSGWAGDLCETIICENGQADFTGAKCECTKPYSGKNCNKLKTEDVYYFYNSKSFALGPLGLLSVIPLICIWCVCEGQAAKRQKRRMNQMLETNASTNSASPAPLPPYVVEVKADEYYYPAVTQTPPLTMRKITMP